MTSSVLYFSPTHTCKKAAEAVYNALSAYGACTLYSATLPEEREMLLKAGIHTTLLVVICPVYAQRPPALLPAQIGPPRGGQWFTGPVHCRSAPSRSD